MTAVRKLASGLVLQHSRPEHAEGLDELQRIVFPTLSPEQRFQATHYLRHIELFPEGQFCVTDGRELRERNVVTQVFTDAIYRGVKWRSCFPILGFDRAKT